MDISSLQNVTSGVIKQAVDNSPIGKKALAANTESFDSIFEKTMQNINTTNNYLSDAENEEIKWMLGETQNTHDLTIAMGKASTALQYTVAVRDKLIEAYKEIMQMQI